jgi:glycosyltransferase involved in cell wall biosynthesis
LRKKLSWPFLHIVDKNGRDTGYAVIQGPVETRDATSTLAYLVRQHTMLGFASFAEFPKWRSAVDRTEYGVLCRGWCHCFRDPDEYLPKGTMRVLISHSDFIDPMRVEPLSICGSERVRKDNDFVYVCLPGKQHALTKNLDLALSCIKILTDRLGLRGVLVGRPPIADLAADERLAFIGELPWNDLMQLLGRSRFLFVPNIRDASPRLLTESLCMNTPVIVNRRILGGWKYVNAFTGAFFNNDEDLGEAVSACLSRHKSPREWYRSHHGPYLAGMRLARFLREVDPFSKRLDDLDFALLTDCLPHGRR